MKLILYDRDSIIGNCLVGLIQLIKSFFIISFIIFSVMYLVPAQEINRFTTIHKWPLSYLVWLINFFTLQLDGNGIGLKYFRTIFLVFSSLGMSLIVVYSLIILKLVFKSKISRLILIVINISSGFHILVLGILYYIWQHPNNIDFGIILILGFGNGSLAEMYNVFEVEVQKIFKKEYITAAVVWGKKPLRYSLRELFINTVELSLSRLPILFSATIIIEHLFSIKGLSYSILKSIRFRDYETLILSTVLISITIIFFNIFVDRIRYYFDPRVRYAE